MNWDNIFAKAVGVLLGTLLSLVMVAPESTKNALYRVIFGGLGAVIFTPITQALFPVFRGDTYEILVAASAATGFTCWFILEFIARIMSSRLTMARLFQELLKLRGIDVKIDIQDPKSNKDIHIESHDAEE